jgi:hypothetical protein
MQLKMRILILTTLFIVCAAFVSFKVITREGNIAGVDSTESNFKKHFTGYNPDFEKRGIVKSSYKHEVINNR